MSRVITIGKYIDEHDIAFFHLKPISITALRAFFAQFAALKDLAEQDRLEKETQLNIEAIAKWSVKPPTKTHTDIESGKTEQVELYPEATSPADAVRERFKEMDQVDAEWMANAVISEYQEALTPKTAFMPPSS